MKFEIKASEVLFKHLNVRSERHGDEDRTAVDLQMVWTTSNESLALFHPGLSRALYEYDRAQQVVEGASPVMTSRAFPDLGPLKWDGEASGLRLVIEHGLGGRSDLVMGDMSADKFVIDVLDGGSVKIQFRARGLCEDERILGKLGTLIKRDLPLTVEREHEVEEVANVASISKSQAKRKAAQTPEQALIDTK